MKKHFPDEYNIFPKTWVLPWDTVEVTKYLRQHKAILIVKPDKGSNGDGISLIRNLKNLPLRDMKNCILQEYISNPFLIDGFKFDFRIYTLITSCDPLRIYTHSDGLVRFATVKYEPPCARNLSKIHMHLTNYSLNKGALSFIQDDEVGSKRKICTMNAWFTRNGYDTNQIWERIDDVIVKTILAGVPNMKEKYNVSYSRHNYRSACFQILGFDILLDDQLRPYVIEVNHSPSFHTDTKLDLEVKEQVLRDTFLVCNLGQSIRSKIHKEERVEAQARLTKRIGEMSESRIWSEDKKTKQWLWEREHMGRYRLLYPCVKGDKYRDMCLVTDATSYYKDTVASNIRMTLGKEQRHKLDMKQSDSEKVQKKIVATRSKLTGNRKLKPTLCKLHSKHLDTIPGAKNNKGKSMVKWNTEHNNISRTSGRNIGRNETNHPMTMSKLRKPVISNIEQLLMRKIGNPLISKVENPLISKVRQPPGQSTCNPCLKINKSVVPFVNRSMRLKELAEARRVAHIKARREEQSLEEKEKERLAELKARHESVTLLGLERLIYFTFKAHNNLSSRDVNKYTYLEETSKK
ncbi:hypothetical protein WDU94_003457 [Cyamophila willieti]